MAINCLSFAGGTDSLTFNIGNFAASGAQAWAFILRPMGDDDAFRAIAEVSPGGTSSAHACLAGPAGYGYNFFYTDASDDVPSSTVVRISQNWMLLVATKAAGTVRIRTTIYVYDTANLASADGTSGGPQPDDSGWTTLKFSASVFGAFAFQCRMLVAGFWDRQLSDAEAASLYRNLAAWRALSPDELIRFDRMTTITSLTGTCVESARSGTALVADAPAGWSDGGALGYQRLAGPTQLSTTLTDLYTVPTGARTTIRHIYINNPSGATVKPTLVIKGYAAAVLADRPVAYYRMGEASGQPQDSSGNGNHTTVTNATPAYSQTGAIVDDANTSIHFVSAAYFTAPDHSTLDFGDAFTLECWVKRHDADASEQALITKGNDGSGAAGGLYLIANTLMLAEVGVAEIVRGTVLVDDTVDFQHCVATKNGATVKLYIDGADVTGTVTNVTCTNSTKPLAIAVEDNNGSVGSTFGGYLDEIAVYNYALSVGRVQTHYQAALLERRFLDLQDISAGRTFAIRRHAQHTLEAGETVQGYADVDATAVIVLDGYVEQV